MSAVVIAMATVTLAMAGIGCLMAGLGPLLIGARRGDLGQDHGLVIGLALLFVVMDLAAAVVGGAVLWVGGL